MKMEDADVTIYFPIKIYGLERMIDWTMKRFFNVELDGDEELTFFTLRILNKMGDKKK